MFDFMNLVKRVTSLNYYSEYFLVDTPFASVAYNFFINRIFKGTDVFVRKKLTFVHASPHSSYTIVYFNTASSMLSIELSTVFPTSYGRTLFKSLH